MLYITYRTANFKYQKTDFSCIYSKMSALKILRLYLTPEYTNYTTIKLNVQILFLLLKKHLTYKNYCFSYIFFLVKCYC